MSDKTLSVDMSLARDAFDVEVKTQFAGQGTTAVFGPSGAGKSSLLRAIAGFETPYAGRIRQGERVFFDKGANINVPSHRRGVGYLFQDARLFSHLTVQGNLDFAHARAPKRGGDILDHIISEFELGSLLQKNVAALSGGEQQRVALARTVLSRPNVLLLDEPLAALDAARKAELLPFIKGLPEAFNIPVIFVSHDLKEVGYLADEIMCLSEGRAAAFGPALDVLPNLQSGPDISFDVTSWFDAKLTEIDHAHQAATWSLSAAHKLILPLTATAQIGDKARLSIRADDVSIALTPPQNISIQNKIDARVKSVTTEGNRICVQLYLPDPDSVLPHLLAFITPLSQAQLQLKQGQAVTALVKSVSFE